MSRLHVRLLANAYHRAFPAMVAELRRYVPDVDLTEPEWLPLLDAMGDGDVDLGWPRWSEAGRVRVPLTRLRVDEGPLDEHVEQLGSFIAGFPGWLVQLLAPHSGIDVRAMPLPMTSSQLIALLPHVLRRDIAVEQACTWPDTTQAALDLTDLDACCDGVDGYLVELFSGLQPAPAPGPWQGQVAWEAIRTALPLGAVVTARVIATRRDGAHVEVDDCPEAVAVLDVEAGDAAVPALARGCRVEARVMDHRRDNRQVRLRLTRLLPPT
ncbi:hypothetical protein CLV92_1023 [Kineococcus xinjiangensis]|uniref:Uncharacterized protein n=1 Tax=Kineococcus xinjiangensis TaxID=512762 RepID=A0A2S6IUM0_9ACTN|nr:hypothetical protein [Kineococcus xinjiangensis]PPK97853.1 hypothetical protein CLV92_1023 [Kineococcus xinjiangensis]